MKSSSYALALLIHISIVGGASAQAEPADTTPDYRLEGVTVSTTRTTVDRARLPRRIDVVSAADIDGSGARTISEAIRGNVALDVIEYPGLLTGVSIRGFRPQIAGVNPRTLVLVDGRPAGTSNLALFHAGSVERVEVLRGPASALYGPNAMGGVVNVIRKRSTGSFSGAADVAYGSFGMYSTGISGGGHLGRGLDFDLSVTVTGQRDGYRTGSDPGADSLLKTLPDGERIRLPWTTADTTLDFSRYASRSVNARIGWVLPTGWRADLSAESYAADDVENPGDLNVVEWDSRTLKDADRRSLDLSVAREPGRFSPSVRGYIATERVDYYSAAEAPHFVNFRTPVRMYGVQVQSSLDLSPATLLAGLDYNVADARSERFTQTGVRGAPYSPDSRIGNASAFAEARFNGLDDRLGLTAGLRFDRIDFTVEETPHLAGFPANSERNDVFSPSAGARFRPLKGVQVYGNLGMAFVTPDAFQVAGYSESRAGEGRRAVSVTRGNPNLDPESSLNADAGITVWSPATGLELDVAYFRTDVRDRIATSLTPGGGELTAGGDTILAIMSPINVDEGEIRGLEARASIDIGSAIGRPLGLRLFLNGTRILRAEERFESSGVTRRIRNVAHTTVIAGLEYDDLDRLSARLAARHVGQRYDTDYVAWWEPGEIRYPPYTVADLHLAFRIGDRYRLRLDLQNLTDEDYFEVRGYNLPGRSLRVGIGATLR